MSFISHFFLKYIVLKLNLLQTQESNLSVSVALSNSFCILSSLPNCHFTRKGSTIAAKMLARPVQAAALSSVEKGISPRLPQSLLTQAVAMCHGLLLRYADSSLILLLISGTPSSVCHHSFSAQPH